jgi:hypothetical protein
MLTSEQKHEFYENGFLKLDNVIPKPMIDAAKKAINHLLGQITEGNVNVAKEGRGKVWKQLANGSVITDLVNKSPVLQLCESLMGKGNVQAVEDSQIALRYPTMEENPVIDERDPLKGHLDLGSVGVKGGYRRFFTMHAVIYLEDVLEPFSGNYTIWPQSHRFYQKYFQKHGHEILLNGQPKQPQPTEPVMITGKTGDVVLAHHQMVHGPAPNTSPHVRYRYFCTDASFNRRHAWAGRPGIHSRIASPIAGRFGDTRSDLRHRNTVSTRPQ